jgi:hypothetical protein
MEDLTTHPLVIVVFAAIVGLLAAAIKAVAALFGRVTKVEATLESVDNKVDLLSQDLRAHMRDEVENMGRLEALIQGIRNRQDN